VSLAQKAAKMRNAINYFTLDTAFESLAEMIGIGGASVLA
jgi:hypothetical protein